MYADGASLTIELADSVEPMPQADAYLADLQRRHPRRFSDIAVRFEHYSIYGRFEPIRELRQSRGDIWEIKTAEGRVLHFELSATSRHKRVVRVTNCCEKSKSKTQEGRLPEHHIRKAEAIKKVDDERG
ncbi:hypothetical protein [Microbacterium sp.]|uniref:hypothetical protein n=1 Tax=Microbacterium sp. TaxID=51671 RepID=UPI0039E5BC78